MPENRLLTHRNGAIGRYLGRRAENGRRKPPGRYSPGCVAGQRPAQNGGK